MKKFKWYFVFSFLVLPCFLSLTAQPRTGFAYEQNKKLGRGVNILSPDERWTNPANARVIEKHFKLLKEGGFDNVRIVMHPFSSVKSETDFTLSKTFFETLDWAVKQSMDNNLMAILDFHEHGAMGKDPIGNKAKFLSIWQQIANHSKDYSQQVLFEIANEPNMESDIWNSLHKDAYTLLRRSNPERTIIIGSRNANQIRFLEDLVLPEDDRNIIIAIHYYSPGQFTHQGAPWSEKNKNLSGITWTGTDEQKKAITSDFDMAKTWAEKNDRPLTLGEFGAYEKADMSSRVNWTSFIAREAEKRNWSWSYWQLDDDFILYDIDKDNWVKPIYDALIPKE